MQPTIRVLLVGYGVMGRNHARVLRTIPSSRLVGIVESGIGARHAAQAAGVPVYSSIEESAAVTYDAAIVAVPTSAHPQVVSELGERCSSIFVEKPLAGTFSDAESMCREAARCRRNLFVGYVERHNPAVRFLKRFINEENLGNIVSIATRRVGAFPARITDANVLIDIGVHDIDIIAYLLQAQLRLVAAQGGRALNEDRLDFATLMLDAGSVMGSVAVNWLTPIKIRDISVTGTKGYCSVDYMTQEMRFSPGRSFNPSESFEDLVEDYRAGETIQMPVERGEPLRCELNAFFDAMRVDEWPSVEIALESLRIAEEATKMIEEPALVP